MQYSVVFFLATIWVLAAAVPQETYTTNWDNLDIAKIIEDEKQLQYYHECLMDRGPCNEEGTELKRVLPEALKTNCKKCTDAQKRGFEKVLIHLLRHRPGNLKELAVKYNPLDLFKNIRPEVVQS